MRPIKTAKTNLVISAPPGFEDQVDSLPVETVPTSIQAGRFLGELRSTWELTEEERRFVVDGGNIQLTIVGAPHPLESQGLEPSFVVPEEAAHALLGALARELGAVEHPEQLRQDYIAERARVDKLLDALIRAPTRPAPLRPDAGALHVRARPGQPGPAPDHARPGGPPHRAGRRHRLRRGPPRTGRGAGALPRPVRLPRDTWAQR